MANLIFDIEADNLYDGATKVHCICIIDADQKKGYKYHDTKGIDRDGPIEDALDHLESASCLIGHNIIGYDIPVLEKIYKVDFSNCGILDTLVLSRMIHADIKEDDWALWRQGKLNAQYVGRHSLEAWGHRLDYFKEEYKGGFEVFSQEMLDYCIQDTRLTYKLYRTFVESMPPAEAVLLENDIAKICFDQQQYGWYFDIDKAYKLHKKLSNKREVILKKLREEVKDRKEYQKTPEHYTFKYKDYPEFQHTSKKKCEDEAYKNLKELGYQGITRKFVQSNLEDGPLKHKNIKFNPGSADHVARFFIEKYNWKPTIFNEKDKKPSITTEILESLDYPEAKLIVEYEILQDRCEKLLEGAKSKWIKHAEKYGDSRIHGGIIPGGAVTSRATHNNPNMSQVPASRKPYGKECRELFTVPKGYKLVGADAEALELCVLAHYLYPYDDGKMARTIAEGDKSKGTDVHSLNQKAMRLPSRDDAKTLIYCIIYGGGYKKIMDTFGKSEKESKQLLKDFRNHMDGYWDLYNYVKDIADSGDYIEGVDGRLLRIRKTYAALNTLIQSDGAIICKLWMVEMHKRIKELGLDASQVGWSHDEVQFEVLEKDVKDLVKIMTDSMIHVEKELDYKCVLRSNVSIGNNWSETH